MGLHCTNSRDNHVVRVIDSCISGYMLELKRGNGWTALESAPNGWDKRVTSCRFKTVEEAVAAAKAFCEPTLVWEKECTVTKKRMRVIYNHENEYCIQTRIKGGWDASSSCAEKEEAIIKAMKILEPQVYWTNAT